MWNRFVRQPQSLWLRKALFQIHLWIGVGVGLYMLLISVTGSAIVFRTELDRALYRGPKTVSVSGKRLTEDELKQAAIRSYPDYEVSSILQPRRPDQAVEVWLDHGSDGKRRQFDPYTGKDLGGLIPFSILALEYIVDLHDNLLAGDRGRTFNGIGGILLTVLCLTGLIIWWPGIESWRRNLAVDWKTNSKRLNWNLHNVIGLWTFLFTLLWAVSGAYLVFQEQMAAIPAFNSLDPASQNRWGVRFGVWITRMHFGRFAGWPVKALWVVLGLAPLILFVTGGVMWWNRVLRPRMRAIGESSVPVLDR